MKIGKVKLRIIISFCLILILNFSFIEITYADIDENINNDSKIKKIILIDPGHGGVDGGAVSKRGTVEKDVNLAISYKLKTHLEQKGYKVVMTRESDYGLYSDKGKIRDKKIEDLNNRCKMKKNSNCDVFVSIHLNMFEQSKYYGAQVWYAVEPKESMDLAHIIQENLKSDLDNGNKRKEKSAKGAYKILRCDNTIPSVIVECGFLSNQQEEENLLNEEFQVKIAESISKSLDEFVNLVEFRYKEDKSKEIEETNENEVDFTIKQYIDEHWEVQ
ncbi:hypothetical protein SH2C18_10350 [Clostridium sediminicola]|uniref:N-acetylmuramoyl-L-alanine amidase CwlD n=1 Tax=Clostridium sediminicola TaxID=3114879 RepID=UPI0031F26552